MDDEHTLSSPDGWTLRAAGFDIERQRGLEALFAIGGGALHQRAVFEEGLGPAPGASRGDAPAAGAPGTFMPSVCGPHASLGVQCINLPAIHGLLLFAGGERLDLVRSAVHDVVQSLDLRRARLCRSLVWRAARGAVLRVAWDRFISLARPNVLAQRCRIEHVDGPPIEIRAIGAIDARVRTNGHDHFRAVEITGEHEPITLSVQTDGGRQVAAAALLTTDRPLAWSVDPQPRWVGLSTATTLERGAALVLHKYSALTAAASDAPPAVDAARMLAWSAASAGFDALARESDASWARRWLACDIEIEGHPRGTLALRLAMHHLLRVSGADREALLDPRAATSEATGGRTTWEVDLLAGPALLYTQPEAGVAIARRRVAMLDGARRNARRGDYPGARFAWEADAGGDERSTDGAARDHAVHVTGGVVFGLAHAVACAPHDAALCAAAAEAAIEASRYWLERLTYIPRRDAYELLMVMGPDVFKPLSRHNAFTARMASFTLQAAVELTRRLGASAPAQREALLARVDAGDAEFERFSFVAARIALPWDEHGLLLQSADFFDYEPSPLARLWPDRSRPLHDFVRLERLHRTQVLREPDALLLMLLMPEEFSAAQMAAAYDAYEPRTAHESALSFAVHAAIAARIGRLDEARAKWDAAVEALLDPGRAADGVRLADCGALWQAAVFGFAGLSRAGAQGFADVAAGDEPVLKPCVPAEWGVMRIPLVWRGASLTVQASAEGVEIRKR